VTKISEINFEENKNYVKVLDKGFVGLVNHLGDDSSIARAARVSYGQGTTSVSDDRNLIRYLMRHWHTTPFEMGEVVFHVRLPIFVMRQLVRHRTASINEYSARYSVMTDEYYLPEKENLKPQSKDNKQGRAGELSNVEKDIYSNTIDRLSKESYAEYEELLSEEGHSSYNIADKQALSRELARMVLPVNYYTEMYWKCDIKNFLGMARLRMDSHAQWEIQEYAKCMYNMVKPLFPITCEAFEDYQLNAVSFSVHEIKLLLDCLDRSKIEEAIQNSTSLGKREIKEFRTKLNGK